MTIDWRERERQRVVAEFETHAHVVNGIVLWHSTGLVPPQDVLDIWAAAGKPFDLEASRREREAQTDAFLTVYRARQARRRPSAEERAEMRAAFGPGAEVVDIVTGRRIRT